MTNTADYGRVDQYEVAIWVGGRYVGIWSDLTGGATTAKETKIRTGAMGDEISLGGQASVTNITAMKPFNRRRDQEERRYLRRSVGKTRCTAVRQPLDADGLPFGDSETFGGMLNGFTPSDVKADSNDADNYTIEISTDGTVG